MGIKDNYRCVYDDMSVAPHAIQSPGRGGT